VSLRRFSKPEPKPLRLSAAQRVAQVYLKLSALDLESLGLASVTEYGVHFRTGTPVTFPYMRNTEGAPKLPKHIQPQYGQDIEPAGRYMLHAPPDAVLSGPWMGDVITFRRPLVLIHGGTSSAPGGWKRRLSDAFGGAKKAALSDAIRRAGFDGIVTVDRHGTSEMVAL
jgi:hypothetical protein